MKPIVVSSISALFLSISASAQGGFVTDAYSKEYVFGSGGSKAAFVQSIFPLGNARDVASVVRLNTSQDAILVPASGTYGFAAGDFISAASASYVTATPLNPSIKALDYTWEVKEPGDLIVQHSVFDPFKGQNDAIIGFRLGLGEQARYGWMRIHRDSIAITTLPPSISDMATPFAPVDAVLNPFPGQPIRAGMPPELPSLQTSVVPDTGGGQGPQLRLQWPAAYAGVRLQRVASLTMTVTWEDVPTDGNDVLVPAPADGEVYYRLAYDF